MKKIITMVLILITAVLSSTPVLAGSVPEDLLHSDDARIFFAEVVEYHPDKEKPGIEFSPTKKIKGDVKLGVKQAAYNPDTVGAFEVEVGKVYLFTYFDENNPTEIFEVTSYDTSTLRLKNVEGDMWERFEKYINEGRYEEAEHERINRMNNELLAEGGKTLTLSEIIGADKNTVGEMTIHYKEGLDSKTAQIDKAEFFKAADTIICNEIEKTDHINSDGFYIVAGARNAVYISEDAKISNNNPMLSYIALAEYKLSSEDLAKLKEHIIPEEETELPSDKTPLTRKLYYIIGGALLGAIIGGLLGFIIGFIVNRIRKVKKSK